MLVLKLKNALRRGVLWALVGASPACADVRPPLSTPLPPTSSLVAGTSLEDPPTSDAPMEPTTDHEGEGDPEEAAPASDPPAPGALPPNMKRYPFHDPVPTALAVDAPGYYFANLSGSDCKAEVTKRSIPAELDKKARGGVQTAMRITGALHGVKVSLPPLKSDNGVLDCRMVLALDALCAQLATMDVVRIRIDNVYRPHAKIAGQKGKPSQHSHAMALDVTAFDTSDGRALKPPADWGATIGDVPCGPNAVMEAPTSNTIELRSLVCAIGRTGLFNTVLSPSFNAAHQSHFHFDLKRDDKHVAIR